MSFNSEKPTLKQPNMLEDFLMAIQDAEGKWMGPKMQQLFP